MPTTLAAESTIFARAQALLPSLRTGERVGILYYLYLSALSWFRHLGFAKRMLLPAWQEQWLGWDRLILDGGLRAAMEIAGFLPPSLLETGCLLPYAFAYATLVFVATIYCRSHYAMGGLASIGIVSTVCAAAGWRGDAIA
jgi:hypothetical protein